MTEYGKICDAVEPWLPDEAETKPVSTNDPTVQALEGELGEVRFFVAPPIPTGGLYTATVDVVGRDLWGGSRMGRQQAPDPAEALLGALSVVQPTIEELRRKCD